MTLNNEHKMIIWGKTLQGAEVYPLTRSDEETVNAKFSYYLNKTMHRRGEINTDV